jgi:hypothetical protein
MRASDQSKAWTPLVAVIVFGGWLALLSAGWWVMTAYEFKRDATTNSGGPIQQWPDDSQLPRVDGLDTMLVFLHPNCPCSRATVAELERLLSKLPNGTRPLRLDIVATVPRSAAPSWAQTSLIERSMKLPHARLHVDRGGTEATRFGAEVSGTVMLFGSSGALRYAGGVTMSRGHEGGSAGRNALERILAREQHAASFPAFGCRLVLEHEAELGAVVEAAPGDHACEESWSGRSLR